VLAGHSGDRLLVDLVVLYREGGPAGRESSACAPATPRPRRSAAGLTEKQEEIAAAVMAALTQIAAAAEARSTMTGLPRSALPGALGGAEWVLLGALRSGGERLAELLPSLAYQASAPFLDHGEALALVARGEALVRGRGLR
jgi:hypothetical protein